MDRKRSVLFLCTGNSARSIMAESLLRHWGKDRFDAYSAGSHPKGEVHPMALAQLQATGMPIDGLRSKSWDEFAAEGAPKLDFVFTVCDTTAAETCPIFPGTPMTAHWGIPDPVAVSGTDIVMRQAFRDAFRVLELRVKLFASLRIDALNRLQLGSQIAEIGKSQVTADAQ